MLFTLVEIRIIVITELRRFFELMCPLMGHRKALLPLSTGIAFEMGMWCRHTVTLNCVSLFFH
jgi:hypothetical protein